MKKQVKLTGTYKIKKESSELKVIIKLCEEMNFLSFVFRVLSKLQLNKSKKGNYETLTKHVLN